MRQSRELRAYKNHIARCKHKTDALGAPVEMRLSFDEWLAIWIASGHWNERGQCAGQYCMSRFNDIGHYEAGNVFIQLHSQNSSQIDHTGRAPSFGMLGKHHSEMSKQLSASKNQGEKSAAAVLTEAKVRQIKQLLLAGIDHRTIAAQFHMSKATISAISTGRNWKHVI